MTSKEYIADEPESQILFNANTAIYHGHNAKTTIP